MPSAELEITHAMTIAASPEQVWPWLVQTGQGRAGFYSDSPFWDRCMDWYYRQLSREKPGKAAVGYQVRVSDRVMPEWQNPHVGDIIADGPPGTAYYVVRHVTPENRPVTTSPRQGSSSCSPTPTCAISYRPGFARIPGSAWSAKSATAAC